MYLNMVHRLTFSTFKETEIKEKLKLFTYFQHCPTWISLWNRIPFESKQYSFLSTQSAEIIEIRLKRKIIKNKTKFNFISLFFEYYGIKWVYSLITPFLVFHLYSWKKLRSINYNYRHEWTLKIASYSWFQFNYLKLLLYLKNFLK